MSKRKEEVYAGLLAVRLLLDDKKNWAKGNLAQNSYGMSVMPKYRTACKWCLVGAFSAVLPKPYEAMWIVHQVVQIAYKGKYGRLSDFNDAKTTTHRDVLKVLDKAIEGLFA